MQLQTLTPEYTLQAKTLWNTHFDDGTPGFCDFLFDIVPMEDIYIAVEDGVPVAMLMAAAELEYKNKKGFYLYSACTAPAFRGRGVMRSLVSFALEQQATRGRLFCVLQPAAPALFDYWKEMGFTNTVYMRRAELEIKRNIWQKADFDIVTASRFRTVRGKHAEDTIVHYTPKSYERYAAYMYTCGGSTVETENAYRVYFTENDRLVIKEIFAASTLHAMQLLQAVRERTGHESAQVLISDNSQLFLGEGTKDPVYLIRGLDEDVYVNLMFE